MFLLFLSWEHKTAHNLEGMVMVGISVIAQSIQNIEVKIIRKHHNPVSLTVDRLSNYLSPGVNKNQSHSQEILCRSQTDKGLLMYGNTSKELVSLLGKKKKRNNKTLTITKPLCFVLRNIVSSETFVRYLGMEEDGSFYVLPPLVTRQMWRKMAFDCCFSQVSRIWVGLITFMTQK